MGLMKECILIGYGKLGKQFESYLKSKYPHLEFLYYDDIAFNQGGPRTARCCPEIRSKSCRHIGVCPNKMG